MRLLKNYSRFLVLFLIALVSSCVYEPIDGTVESNPDSGSSDISAGFKAGFDGKTWIASNVQAIVNTDYISITAMKSDGSFFQITLPKAQVGTYNWSNVTTDTPLVLAYSTASGQVPFVSESDSNASISGYTDYVDTAELVITSINTTTKIISGTFKFTGVRFDNTLTKTETKIFTKGQFSVPFTTNNPTTPTTPTTPLTNKFFCKIDGTDFIPTNINAIKGLGLISIIGRKGSVENISLSLVSGITPGTYDLESLPLGTNNIAQYNIDMTGQNIFVSDPGKVTITTHNTTTKHIVGTFQFTATSFLNLTTHTITNGSFDVYYL